MNKVISEKLITREICVKWDKVVNHDPIVRWIDLGNGTLFRILAYHVNNTFNMPREGFFVAIERVGAFFFRVNSHLSTAYISEKLSLPESDAAIMADWINTQIGKYKKQQGIYNAGIINELSGQYYNYAGEKAFIPLHPQIINMELNNEL